ncbi:hypothetical protein GCM10008935_16770 [Alkalibacillus silvisoli]|uniref:Uncharacterized protein n=1 Tax=Alkalibacillus silvisoli TaxID=392823 RepID=A0ABN0ZX47_9BACI
MIINRFIVKEAACNEAKHSFNRGRLINIHKHLARGQILKKDYASSNAKTIILVFALANIVEK